MDDSSYRIMWVILSFLFLSYDSKCGKGFSVSFYLLGRGLSIGLNEFINGLLNFAIFLTLLSHPGLVAIMIYTQPSILGIIMGGNSNNCVSFCTYLSIKS